MEKSVAQFTNRGMYQDVSISKATNEYAFENRNIRITALDNHTLFSITNERQIANVKSDEDESICLLGLPVGHALLNNKIILFTHSTDNKETPDRIYKIDFSVNDTNPSIETLYSGNLNFSEESSIQTLPYYESESIQKVYWVDGKNPNRMININNVWKKSGDDTQFDFNPTVDIIPIVEITKEHKGIGQFPSGVIQYFISYYDDFGAESAIAWSSPLHYLDFETRGASPEEIVNCSFRIKINRADGSYDNIRLYSIKRTSLNSEVQCNIVAEIPIPKSSIGSNNEAYVTYDILDDNKNQQSVDPLKLYFLGGKNFISSTIAQKNDTLFLGNIKTLSTIDTKLLDDIKSELEDTIDKTGDFNKSTIVEFTTKEIKGSIVTNFYYDSNYLKYSEDKFKTFKRGEIYRFAIQFQNKVGEWTNPIWIGDLKCNISPDITVDDYIEKYTIPTVRLKDNSISEDLYNKLEILFYNYRILIADNSNDRTIVAQGIVCPTVFNYEERVENKQYSIASWIMRPRGGNAVWKHMDHTGAEIHGQDIKLAPVNVPIKEANIDGEETLLDYNGVLIMLTSATNHRLYAAIHNCVMEPSDNITDIKLIKSNSWNEGSWKAVYNRLIKWLRNDIDEDNINKILNETNFIEFCKRQADSSDSSVSLGGDWTEKSGLPTSKQMPFNLPNGVKNTVYIKLAYNDLTNTGKTDLKFDSKKNYYYVDNSVVTFHSPDFETIGNSINNADLKFRIVGIAPISSSFSDFDIQLKTTGLSQGAAFNKSVITNYPNLSKITETLVNKPLYRDLNWIREYNLGNGISGYIPDTSFVDYDIFLWHKQGSLVGQNENTYQSLSGNNFDAVQADLESKIFATQRFSYKTKFIKEESNFWKPTNISNVQYFNSNDIEVKQFDVSESQKQIYYGNYDKLLTVTEPYTVGKLHQYDPIRIKYKSTPHTLFALQNTEKGILDILPRLESDDSEKYEDIYELDDKIPHYPWCFKESVTMSPRCFGILTQQQIIGNLGSFKDNDIETTSYISRTYPKTYSLIQKISENSNKGDILGIFIVLNTHPLDDSPEYIYRFGYMVCSKEEFRFKIVWSPEIDNATTIKGEKGEYNYIVNKIIPVSGFVDEEDGKNRIDKLLPSSYLYVNKSTYNIEYVYGINYQDQFTIKKEILDSEGYSYLYIGELYKDIKYKDLYGGTNPSSLESLTWYPISNSAKLGNQFTCFGGDTYYQRWDCLKTYPYTEKDINSVVDITSVMVETRINLDGRYDKNKGTTNILNIRPHNFNLINQVYSQQNNFFSYNILKDKHDLNTYSNQITWSLQKTPTSTHDVWTSISLSNVLNLDGVYGKINNIINYNDTILAFQDKCISVINFNNRTALSTTGGLPIEIANSDKVEGYRILTSTSGCTNKNLSIITNNGLYYVDINNNSLYRFNGEGLSNISEKGMSVWFKNNIKNIERLLYDSVLQDLYIITNNDVLIFNEKLQSFTTFVDTIDNADKYMFSINGKCYVWKSDSGSWLYQTHAGNYVENYKMIYRINPEPLIDKVFTNIEYLSELYDKDGNNINKSPFESLEVENEYQYGKTLISNTKYPMNRRKFRIWRMDLPRDARSKWGLDRIRSPWITLTLNGKNNGERLEFHNLNVIYYK